MHQQLIPERDTGPTPKPKPRSRTSKATSVISSQNRTQLSSSLKYPQENDVDDVISLSSISSITSSGIDNLAYKDDEDNEARISKIQESGLHPYPRQPPHHQSHQQMLKQMQMTPAERKYFSSDSENDNQAIVQHQVLAADIHTFSIPIAANNSKDDIDQGSFELQERNNSWGNNNEQEHRLHSPTRLVELNSNLQLKPKPKPRSKTSTKSMSESDEGSGNRPNDNKTKGGSILSDPFKSEVRTKGDYLIVRMPPDMDEVKDQREGTNPKLLKSKNVDSDDESESDVDSQEHSFSVNKQHVNFGSGSNSNTEHSTPNKTTTTTTTTTPSSKFKMKPNSGNFVTKWKQAAQTLVSSSNQNQNKDTVQGQGASGTGWSSKKAKVKTKSNKKPDTRIDIETLEPSQSSSPENISLNSPPITTSTKTASKFTTKFKDKYNNDIQDPKTAIQGQNGADLTKTRVLVKGDEESEIERLKTFLSPMVTKRKTKSKSRDTQENENKKLNQGEGQSLSPTGSPAVASPSKRERRRTEKLEGGEKYFGVTIHSCDLLPMDPNIVHPVVKVTILNEDGTCLKKHAPSAMTSYGRGVSGTGSSAHLSSPQQSMSTSAAASKLKSSRKKSDDKPKREREDSKVDPSGKSKSKSRNLTTSSSKSQMGSQLPNITADSVLPIMTQPCKLSYYLPTFAPNWNELLLFEEPFISIVHPESMAILFFEIMDFLPVQGSQKTSRLFNEYHGSEEGWYKVAWGFLKLIGANRVRNVNRKVRLQLYKPEQLPSKYAKAGSVEVYQWWKMNRRRKLNATLYVTVKGITPPVQTSASLRTLLTMQKDHLAQAILESQLKSPKSVKRKDSAEELKRKVGKTDIKMPQWSRLEGQSCKVPNKIFKTLPASQIESLSLTISANVQCVKFSPCGMKLAAGLDTDELHTVLVFEVPSGKLLSNIRCHHGLIYDLDWKILEMRNIAVPKSYYLASASADTTCTVWEIRGVDETPKLVKKLLHPSFVYCVKIHPTKSNLVFTGCFDYVIRIWDIQKKSPSRANLHNVETESVPLCLLDKHDSFVNCIVFDGIGNNIYTGDGGGTVFEWMTRSPAKKKSWKVEREIQFRESGKCPINSLAMHPAGNRLLVHVRNSSIKLVDLPTFLVLHTFNGLVNDKFQVQSCFSPCGNIVLSGSEDATLCIWDADTGSILQFLTPENHRNCIVTSVDYHPHDHYVVIGLASTISEPSPIIVYTYIPPKAPRKLRLQTLSKFATLSKKSSGDFSTFSSAEGQEQEYDKLTDNYDYDDEFNLNGQPGAAPSMSTFNGNFGMMSRGDSTEKFRMIVKKLDSALKTTRRSHPQLASITIPTTSRIPDTDSQQPKLTLTDPNLAVSEKSLKSPRAKIKVNSKEQEVIHDMFTSKGSSGAIHSKSQSKQKPTETASLNITSQNQSQKYPFSSSPNKFFNNVNSSPKTLTSNPTVQNETDSPHILHKKISDSNTIMLYEGDTIQNDSKKLSTRNHDHEGDVHDEDGGDHEGLIDNNKKNKEIVVESRSQVILHGTVRKSQSPIQEEPEKDNSYMTSDASGQVSKVRQKRRERKRLLYESSDY